MIWVIATVISALVIAAAPLLWGFVREKPLTEEIRRNRAPGKTLSLSAGNVHFVERGLPDGPVVVMVHGFSTPLFVFDQNADALSNAGYRVIMFDHFGRGWSDRPPALYDADFFDRELLDLLDTLGLAEPVSLVGYSMGGIIAAEFTARHPARVRNLFLITTAGLESSIFSNSLVARLVDIPLIGDWTWRLCGRTTVVGDPQYDDTDLSPDRCLKGDVSEQMKYRGCLPALLSTLRNLPMQDRDDTFGKAAQTGVPIMAVFGGEDPAIGSASPDRLRAVAPQAHIEVIPQGNHGLNYQMYEILNPWLVDFLRPRQTGADHPDGGAGHSVG